jgi:hypothetical protein
VNSSTFRQVLDCASPLALSSGRAPFPKAAEDCRTPGRWRDSETANEFMPTMRDFEIVQPIYDRVRSDILCFRRLSSRCRKSSTKYPNDLGIEKDPAVFFSENFESGDMKKWDQVRGRVVMIEDKPNSGRWCVQMPMERGKRNSPQSATQHSGKPHSKSLQNRA